MTPPTVTDTAIEMMLRERGGAMVPSGLEKAILGAVRTESARAGSPRRRWLARPAFRPALAFALAGLLLAAGMAATFVGGQKGVSLPAGVGSPAPSTSPAASTAADGLILFGIDVPVGDGSGGVTHCTMFHTIRPDGSEERQLPVACMPYGNASWGPCMPSGSGNCGPTGDSIIIDSHTLSSSITEIDEFVVGGDGPGVLLTLAGVYEPTFSPDGSQIAYTADSGIDIAAADGTHPRHLTSFPDPNNDFDWDARFSPDGSRLVFTGDPAGGTSEVWMVNTDGTDLHRLTAVMSESDFARWSSDGSHLLFTGRETSGGPDGLWTIDADGTGLTPIIPDTGGSSVNQADWSPDGSRIVFRHYEAGVFYLRVMNADGSGATTLLSSASDQPTHRSLDWGLPNTLPTEAP